ncbi:MAG: gliding motility-associated C-terminal domain-containing protein [Bacteroidetes bacterium]|nr:gliding motility-associated C-terminal domain-containing protein [Bacteroidota bacterium]
MIRRFLFILLSALFALPLFGQLARIDDLNLSSFSPRIISKAKELNLVSEKHRSNPEFGILPFSAPPSGNCVELLDRRDAFSRYFVEAGSDGKHYFQQTAYGPINYQDKNGWWREINYRLSPDATIPGKFVAKNQPEPSSIDLNTKETEFLIDGIPLRFNRNLELFHEDENGLITKLGLPDWSHFTAGDDGVRIMNFYPKIDLVFMVKQGMLETSFILNSKPSFSSGWFVMSQEFALPQDWKMEAEYFSSNHFGVATEVHLFDEHQVVKANVDKCYAYDNHASPNRADLSSKIENGNTLLVYTPINWLTDPSTAYPVVIDPAVTTQNTLALGSITGTKFGAVCWTNSCDYNLAVNTPANTTVTNIYTSFEYFASGACFGQDGGFSIDYGACHFPTVAPGVITCPIPLTNVNCGVVNNTTLPDFTPCLPLPSCAAQNLNFTLHFYRCNNDPNPVCGSACVRASQPWIMIIEGRTLELNTITPPQAICGGDSVLISSVPSYGVQPYQFAWNPLFANNDSIYVRPATTTTYTLTVTDACGSTMSASSTVTVTPNVNPGFTFSQNPVCIGQPVTLFGAGGGAVSSYDWTLPGSSAPGGTILNNKQPIISYAIQGSYPVTLNYSNAGCIFDSTLTLTVDGLNAATVALSTVPASAICPGDTMHFYATPTNGGTAPVYTFFVDGIQVQTGSADSLAWNTLNNGSLVQVVMNSNSSCASPTIDTASVFVNVTNAVSPVVTISPDTTVCPGSPVTFTTSVMNAGATPAYQWTVNGVNAGGANASTFTTTITATDTIIGVTMTSSLGCVATPSDQDTVHVALTTPATPVVSIAANPAGAICQGDSVQYTASSVYGGSAPSFQWFVNGIPAGIASSDSTFTFTNPSNGDSVSVALASNAVCVSSTNANSYSLITVTPAASPAVTLTALPSTSICQGDQIDFTASSSGAGSTPSFSWYINGILQSDTDSLFSSTSLGNNDSISVVVQSSLTCAILPSDSDDVVVNVSATVAPTISVAPATTGLCVGDIIQLIATTTNGGSAPIINWTQNGLPVGSNNDTISLPLSNGDIIAASLTSNSACATVPTVQSNNFIAALSAYVTPAVSITAVPGSTICQGQTVNFSAIPTDGGASPVYDWLVNGISSGNGNPFQSSALQQNDQVSVVITSSSPCVTQANANSNTIQITTFPALSVFILGTGNVCPGTPVPLIANPAGGDGGPYSYNWSQSLLDTNSIIVYPQSTGYVNVTITDQCGSNPVEDSILVRVLTAPQANFIYSPDEPSTFNNTVQFLNQSTNTSSWTWYFSDGDTTNVLNPVHTFQSPGTYDVLLVTKSASGCYDTLNYRVIVREDISVFYPNSFTPNDDLINETWSPIGASLGDYEFTIWDRWGEKIFDGNKNKPWDGSVNGSSHPAHDGVYVYRVDLKDSKFEKQVVTGRVTIVR